MEMIDRGRVGNGRASAEINLRRLDYAARRGCRARRRAGIGPFLAKKPGRREGNGQGGSAHRIVACPDQPDADIARDWHAADGEAVAAELRHRIGCDGAFADSVTFAREIASKEYLYRLRTVIPLAQTDGIINDQPDSRP